MLMVVVLTFMTMMMHDTDADTDDETDDHTNDDTENDTDDGGRGNL